MRLIANNLIVLGIFVLVGIATFLYGFISYSLLETTKIGKTFHNVLFITQFFIWLSMYFFLARAFLRFTGNHLFDITTFSLAIVLSALFVLINNELFIDPYEMVMSPKMMFEFIWGYTTSPSLILGVAAEYRIGTHIGRLTYCIAVLISIVVQYFGMTSRGIR